MSRIRSCSFHLSSKSWISEVQKPLVSEDLSRSSSLHQNTKTKAWINEDKRRVIVEDLSGGQSHEYPWVWLRDNCQCSECYEPISHCRIINLTEWSLDIKPREVSVSGHTNINIFLTNHCNNSISVQMTV